MKFKVKVSNEDWEMEEWYELDDEDEAIEMAIKDFESDPDCGKATEAIITDFEEEEDEDDYEEDKDYNPRWCYYPNGDWDVIE